MKLSKNTIYVLILLIVVAALYRLIPMRPAGFAPQMAMALFGGAMIRDKRWALSFPIFSLFLSDLLFQGLYMAGVTDIKGLYAGQWQLYFCFLLITVFGFFLKKINLKNVALFTISGSGLFFIISNFMVWIGGGGFARPKTIEGLIQCYVDALIFYRDGGLIHGFAGNFIFGDLFFAAVLFGGYFLMRPKSIAEQQVVLSRK